MVYERWVSRLARPWAGAALEAAVSEVAAAGGYHFWDPELKRVPRGFDTDHPRGQWLRRKGLPVFSPQLERELALRPELVDEAMVHFRNMAPVWKWLMEYVNRG
jgi:uncharacterized protein (DUF2461 family)